MAAVGRVPYRVKSVSSEDSLYPVKQLLHATPGGNGWQAVRNCVYPQQLVLELDQPYQLLQIQLLAHEYKIPTRVELSAGLLDADQASVTWQKMGWITFDSNERTNFEARELKSVHVTVQAQFLQLDIMACHQNRRNQHKQVGLVAINLIGDKATSSQTAPADAFPSSHRISDSTATGAVTGADNSPGVTGPMTVARTSSRGVDTASVDRETAGRMLEVQARKQAAIDAEDYDEAKRLKLVMDRLKALGEQIQDLERRKAVAVQEEDYDLCKALKQQIERIRSSAEYQAASHMQLLPAVAHESARSSSMLVAADQHAQSGAAMQQRSRVLLQGSVCNNSSHMGSMDDRAGRMGGAMDHDVAACQDTLHTDMPSPVSSARYSMAVVQSAGAAGDAYDERPVKGRGVYKLEGTAEEQLNPNTPGTRSSVAATDRGPAGAEAVTGAPTGPLTPGFPTDLPLPEAVSLAHMKDADPLYVLLGDHLTRCCFSRVWQLREAALLHIQKLLMDGTLHAADARDAYRGLLRMVLLSLKDKVANVVNAALGLLRVLVAHYSATAAAKDVGATLPDWLPVVVDKACDSNARTKEAATALTLYLGSVREVNLGGHTSAFVKPLKNSSAWKVMLGRLQLIYALLPVLGIGTSDRFQLETLMRFVGVAFSNANAEVRNIAVKVTAEVAKAVGPVVLKHLPNDINPKIKEQLLIAIGNDDSGFVAASTPAKLASEAPGATAQSPSQGRKTSKSSSAAAPVQKVHRSSSSADTEGTSVGKGAGQAKVPVRVSSCGDNKVHKAVATVTAVATASDIAPAVAALTLQDGAAVQEAAPASSIDAFEADIRSKETTLGPTHPDVADSLANLALLYSQGEQVAKAQVLYERALAILESNFGPNHPQVAHALTDLAVLHLEQGREDIGRPLLERALGIQQKHLGPTHPDVVAIRDVLFGDGDD